jgi:IS30 family transposase
MKRSIKSYSHQHIREIQDWINSYPGKILGYASPEEVFYQDLIAS